MKIEDNPDKGYRVWLSESETTELLDTIEDTEQRLAVSMMVRCGLRTKEVLRARPADVRSMDGDDNGHKLRVWEGKGNQYRETWIPSDLAESIRIYADMADLDDSDRLIDVSRRTIQRWVKSASDTLKERTGDDGWSHLSPHDLRRTWGTQAIESGVVPTVVMQCGGWDDFKTFQQHYMGHHGDRVIAAEADKVLS